MPKATFLQRKGTAAVTSLHVRLYRLSHGRLGSTLGGNPILLLTTTGRKTGAIRTRPVMALRDGHRFIVCGSFAGSDTTPAWALNLAASGMATVEMGGRTLEVTAHRAEESEYDRLWTLLTSEMPTFEKYRTMTSRQMPLFVLTPTGLHLA
jgi:F420H(2)-dependent quinone reductase